jgi:hypothetical protein
MILPAGFGGITNYGEKLLHTPFFPYGILLQPLTMELEENCYPSANSVLDPPPLRGIIGGWRELCNIL